jgi:hypothetical protein
VINIIGVKSILLFKIQLYTILRGWWFVQTIADYLKKLKNGVQKYK